MATASNAGGQRRAIDVLCEVSLHLVEQICQGTIISSAPAGYGSDGFGGGGYGGGVGFDIILSTTVPIAFTLYPGALVVIGYLLPNEELVTVLNVDTVNNSFEAILANVHLPGEPVLGATFPTQQTTDPLYTQQEMLGYLARAQNDFLNKVPLILDLFGGNLIQVGQQFYLLPPTAIECERVAVQNGLDSEPIATISRTAGVVTATLTSPSDFTPQLPVLVLGVADPTFNSISDYYTFPLTTVSPDGLTLTWPSTILDPATTCFEMDQSAFLPTNDGFSSFGGTWTVPITLLSAVSPPSDPYTDWVVTQPAPALILTFYDSAFSVLAEIDLSTVISSTVVLPPAGTVNFAISVSAPVAGATYSVTFTRSGNFCSYTALPASVGSPNFMTEFRSDVTTPFGPNLWPLVPASLGDTYTAPDGAGFSITFYDAGFNVLLTAPATSLSVAPVGTAWWTVQLSPAAAPGPYGLEGQGCTSGTVTSSGGVVGAPVLTRLYESAQEQIAMANPFWQMDTASQVPTNWYEDRSGVYGWGVAPLPRSNFWTELLCSVRDTEELGMLDSFLLPDCFVPYLKYYVLACSWGGSKEQRSPSLAKFCQSRFDFGVMLADRFLRNVVEGQQQGGR